jgi:hypothetical protein
MLLSCIKAQVSRHYSVCAEWGFIFSESQAKKGKCASGLKAVSLAHVLKRFGMQSIDYLKVLATTQHTAQLHGLYVVQLEWSSCDAVLQIGEVGTGTQLLCSM